MGGSSTGGECGSRGASAGIASSAAPASAIADESARSVTIFSPVQRPGVPRDRDRVQPELEDLGDRRPARAPASRGCGTSARRRRERSRTWPSGRPRSARRHRPAGRCPRGCCGGSRRRRGRSPGDFPYQKPVTPCLVAPGSSPSSCVPPTAVAASSSLRPGRKTMPAGVEVPRGALQLEVQAAERRARIAADEDARVVAAPRVQPAQVEHHPHERLHPVRAGSGRTTAV